MKKRVLLVLGIVGSLLGGQAFAFASINQDSVDFDADESNEEIEFVYDIEILFGIDVENRFYLGDDFNDISPGLALTLDLQYGNFFIESGRKNRASAVLGRAYLGYHLWHDDNSSVDIISGSYIPGIEKLDKDEEPIPELVNLENRKEDYDFGLRYIYTAENYFVSTEIVKDLFELSHEGWVVDSYVGSFSSYANWDFSYGFGHSWYSSKATNYHFGVKPNEVAPGIQAYSTGPAYSFYLEASAKTPISEDWVFETGFSHSWISDNISQSPLVIDNRVTEFFMGFGYVF